MTELAPSRDTPRVITLDLLVLFNCFRTGLLIVVRWILILKASCLHGLVVSLVMV